MGRLVWKLEDYDYDEQDEGVGPWWIDDGDTSDEWITRSQAEKIASDGGHEFVPDD